MEMVFGDIGWEYDSLFPSLYVANGGFYNSLSSKKHPNGDFAASVSSCLETQIASCVFRGRTGIIDVLIVVGMIDCSSTTS